MQRITFWNIPALALASALLASAPVMADDTAKADDHGHDHSHDHAHDHDHTHAEGQDDKSRIYRGYFDDAQVAPRPLTDWEGDWQSVYPYLQDGTLDPVMAHKAESGDKSAADYRAYYDTGYQTDMDRITIAGDQITFHRGTAQAVATYAPDGFEVLTYEKGNRGVRFVFRKVQGDDAAPGFIQFSDHKIAPEAADHYHLYAGDDRAALLTEMTNWPTYYPATLDGAAIVAEMLAH
ncbi:metal-binding protein ZinT [Paracoccus sp. DMF-8]|uniref:ZinT family metal-binding protein n=1 Tax=Paracoccus sp. DMF-8 TaxID=3019445 RepID=UPI0023E8BC59|nr:metal-binding protein ZinT [Paracoccus sp. DMF-8]MDF3606154.1 metal-binding protein ZinT [Paracoccus sp. DMF-8]